MVTYLVRSILVSVAMVATLLGGTALADYGPVGTLEQLARSGVVIVRGDVYSIDSAWEGQTIYTYVTVDVADVLRGDLPSRRITLKQLGGSVGNLSLDVGGQAKFAPGEEVLLFLALRPRDKTLMTVALWQGKWTVRRDLDAEQPQVVRFAGRDSDGAPVLYVQLALAEVERVAREVIRVQRRAPEPVVFMPPEAPEPVNTVDSRVGRVYKKIPLIGYSWHETFTGGTIPVHYSKARQPGTGSGKKQIPIAFGLWNDVAKTVPVFSKGKKYKGSADGSELRDPRCLADTVVFHGDPNGEIDDDADGDGVAPLAVAAAYNFTTIPPIRKLKKACNGFVITNDWSVAIAFLRNKNCYTKIVGHELAHVGGLLHSNKTGNLMFPSVSQSDCNQAVALSNAVASTLGKDDKKFWKKIYNRKFAQ